MSSYSRVSALLAGLALGSAATWTIHHYRPASDPRSTAKPLASSSLSSGSSLPFPLPPRLAGPEATAALAAYIALPPLPDKPLAADRVARIAALRALLTLLPTDSFGQLLAASAERTGATERELRWIAFDLWLEHDPAAAANWSAALVPGKAINQKDRLRHLQKAAQAWAAHNFSDAYAWACALSETDLHDTAVGTALTTLAAADPARAATLAQSQGSDFFAAHQDELFDAWAAQDPAVALQSLGPAMLENRTAQWNMNEAVSAWIARDPTAALAWVYAQGDLDRKGLLNTSSLLNALVAPGAVLDLMAVHSATDPQDNRFQSLLSAWLRKDTAAASTWLDTLPDAARRADLLTRAVSDLRETPDIALSLASRLPDAARDKTVASILGNWARSDPDAALAWLAAHDSPSLAPAAAGVQATLLGALAATDPASALTRWQALTDPKAKADTVSEISRSWARLDPAAASRWLSEQLAASADNTAKNPFSGANMALSVTAYAWSRKDPLAALRWAEALPSATQREAALNALNGTRSDPVSRPVVADLYAQLTDPELRRTRLTTHLTSWAYSDLPAVRTWLETHDALTAEEAAAILQSKKD